MSETRFDLKDRTMIIVGMEERDAVFTSERAGHFNVTRARRWAEWNLPKSAVRLDVLDTLRGLQKNADLDKDRLLEIAARSFDEVLRIVWLSLRCAAAERISRSCRRLRSFSRQSKPSNSKSRISSAIPTDASARFLQKNCS